MKSNDSSISASKQNDIKTLEMTKNIDTKNSSVAKLVASNITVISNQSNNKNVSKHQLTTISNFIKT